MNDIDDQYDAHSEAIEQSFFEEIEAGTERKKALNKYVQNLDNLRAKREAEYKKYVAKRKKEIWSKKEKKEKKKPFKHLEVQHFDFQFSFTERMKQRIDVSWFRFKRFITITFKGNTPRFMLRAYYSFKKDLQSSWESISEFFERWKTRIKQFFTRIGIAIWKFSIKLGKKSWSTTKKVFSILLFWKKKEDETTEKTAEEAPKKEGETKETQPESA